MDRSQIEILSPAGNLEKLKFVVAYGCDAVYMSGKSFGLRTFSDNFDHEEMKEGIRFAHEHGVKCYVTMNILATEEDMSRIDEEIEFVAHEAHADAVLVSDPGIFARIRRIAPDLEIHISTQASVTNSGACSFWQEMGASRIVLAREVSLKQIREIRKHIDPGLQIECFVHGAMCVSYSGRCLLSNYFTGRRANGGSCAQPCRWGYALVEEKRPDLAMPVEQDERGTYILGSKDICMIDHIPEMIRSGIDSFKIEGRIKGAFYAACATKVYREAVDRFFEDPDNYTVDPRWKDLLEKVVHRDYDTGFFFDSPSEDAKIDYEKSYNKPAFIVGIVQATDKPGLVKVVQKNKLYKGDVLNVMQPEGYREPVKVQKLYNAKMEEIESVPNPETVFYMDIGESEGIPEMSFLSRDGDKDYGIKPQN